MSQVSVDSLREVVEKDKLPLSVASMYLRLYVAEIDWEQQISVLYSRMSKKNLQDVNSFMRQVIACTILLRAYQPSVPLDLQSPESLLFSIHKFHQFEEKDWFAQLQSVIKRDIEIQEIGLRPGEKMFEELALEMEECHKTDNNLIFVHEKMDIDSKEVDSKLNKLKELMNHTDDKLQIKEVLMDMIKE